MERFIQLQRKLAPELIQTIEARYNLLRHIQHAQPIGRRALAAMLDVGERGVRAQVDWLKNAGLVEFSQLGISVTAEGQALLPDLAEYVRLLHDLVGLEDELAERLNLKKVVIIPGDSEADIAVRRELGRAAAGVLGEYLGDNMIVAVSGGSTMAKVAAAIHFTLPTTTVVPARGGLGEIVEYQANTIAAVMANKLGGRYRLLHIPDGVNEETLEAILAGDANLKAVADMIKEADILVHGIGEAAEMAGRRGVAASTIAEIEQAGAVGEALGQYCALPGKVVYVTSSIGLRLDDLAGIGTVIAVAGGKAKAKAILAVAGTGGQDVLITDEAAAKAIQLLINTNNF
ncbi:sugar-binding transcriptional regulator [Sporomusa acidovorans]|uniref:Central glycolytic genes regulator n=1 Tax=Sporomusa acidovorans (strain ATCC 49682 / DSM 3132 / Mol) TaxID=1123286 RepID=A0ABZ3J6I7_SPOA4|nr:sugar-binding domain-containing protein [Sporomusa acidovorans]OZC24060.1 central glycolytic protein regulator [Sporomusa acidovorans DSM 3132]SDF59330.1 central glycolytic genes regulator [Sporomusa acidovorans]